jgi:hypothetical protein
VNDTTKGIESNWFHFKGEYLISFRSYLAFVSFYLINELKVSLSTILLAESIGKRIEMWRRAKKKRKRKGKRE